jgi:hypothetical protein
VDVQEGTSNKLLAVLISYGVAVLSDYLIEEDSLDCLWEELIVNKKGAKTFLDHGMDTKNCNFSEEMTDLMLEEVNRLIDKYSLSPWNSKQTANDLVSILKEDKVALEEELIEVQVGSKYPVRVEQEETSRRRSRYN